MNSPLLKSELPGLPSPKRGKVRDTYEIGDRLLIVSTDRISAFDSVLPTGIPDKGRILNQMSAFWFRMFEDVCPNHVINVDDGQIESVVGSLGELAGRSTLAKKAEPLMIECVARGYIAGSLFKEYQAFGSRVHGLTLPDRLEEGSKLPEPIFTPATKATSGHDENISFERAIAIVGERDAIQVREWTLELYRKAHAHAEERGILLADTKFEFGRTEQGLIWIDEALTPDSSRFWNAAHYEPGKAQASYDKQFVRDYLTSTGWDKSPPAPELPEDVVKRTREKYLEAFERLTGSSLRT